MVWFLVSLFNGISTFMSNSMLKPSLWKNSSGAIWPLDGGDKVFRTFSKGISLSTYILLLVKALFQISSTLSVNTATFKHASPSRRCLECTDFISCKGIRLSATHHKGYLGYDIKLVLLQFSCFWECRVPWLPSSL